MNVYLIIVATLCYLITSYGNLRQGDYPHALMWFSYSVANMSLLWYEWNKSS